MGLVFQSSPWSEVQLYIDSKWRRGSGRKEKFRQPLKDFSNKGRVSSQVLISVSQSNPDFYKHLCSCMLNDTVNLVAKEE